MSQVLYSEAEGVGRQALRELLLEASKERLRASLGDKIAALADLAVGELVTDILSSLEIEARMGQRHEKGSDVSERLRNIFAPPASGGGAGPAPAGRQPREGRTGSRGGSKR